MYPPISPCGAPVEYLRSAYRTQVRFYKDRPDILTPIIWYFTDREDWIPWPHKFGSQNWDEHHPIDGCPVGEVGGSPKWYSGARPPEARDGPHPCGTPAQWAGDMVYADARANPCDCGGVQGEGRNVQTGQGRYVSPWPSGKGAGFLVHYGVGQTPPIDAGTGYLVQHGVGQTPPIDAGTGYLVQLGVGLPVQSGVGYLVQTGQGEVKSGDGGIGIGGSAAVAKNHPSGGIGIGGSAVVTNIHPSGGIGLGGTTQPETQTGTGYLVQSGEGEPVDPTTAWWQFEESSGTRFDSSGNGYDLDVLSGTITRVSGQVDFAVELSATGVGQSSELARADSGDAFDVFNVSRSLLLECWFKVDAPSSAFFSQATIFEKTGEYRVLVNTNGTTVDLQWEFEGDGFAFSSLLNVGQWYRLRAGTGPAGGQWFLEVDDVLAAASPSISGFTPGGDIRLRAITNASSSTTIALAVDELKVWIADL